ncbi:hypothetical protein IWW38_001635 [Coemansia aciculifera]|uniref:Uncharacterized protein n=1 Tax=Coemansia aciculifera TaxID=417176 RepID=A0ACC1M7F6_9FUNG|nr:hypothetical protein IWW38_001635 [Coemansia aciculifera]
MGISTQLYAKKLNITLNALDVYSGAALNALLSKDNADLSFPVVRSLSFTLDKPTAEDQAGDATPADFESNIDAFIQRVKQLVPKVKKAAVSFTSFPDNGIHYPVQQISVLVAQLSRLSADIDYSLSYQPVDLDLQLSGLTSLKYSTNERNNGSGTATILARLNASTLQRLNIGSMEPIGASSLIQNSDGAYVQYPCLLDLDLSGPRDPNAARSVFPDAMPFPHLWRLSMWCTYPFGDDTPFRGNATTLVSLMLFSCPGISRILRTHRVFTPFSHLRLQYVNIRVREDFEPGHFEDDGDYMRFALSIGPNAPVRGLNELLEDSSIQTVIPVLCDHSCIQVLSIFSSNLTVWDAIALVKALPLLTDLRTLTPVLGPLPDGVRKHKLPAYVIENYAPANQRFRCWDFDCRREDNPQGAVRCVLLLALVCPNFDYAAVCFLDRPLFMAYMKDMIVTNGFRPHKTRLRRLLFGGVKNTLPNLKTVLAEP